jgi:hypothetical protein
MLVVPVRVCKWRDRANCQTKRILLALVTRSILVLSTASFGAARFRALVRVVLRNFIQVGAKPDYTIFQAGIRSKAHHAEENQEAAPA